MDAAKYKSDRGGALKRNSVITVRDIDPGDKSWVRREAEHHGVSMEECADPGDEAPPRPEADLQAGP